MANFEVGFSSGSHKNARVLGKRLASEALDMIKEHSPVIAFIFSSCELNLTESLRGIGEILEDVPIVGMATSEPDFGNKYVNLQIIILASPFVKATVSFVSSVSDNPENRIKELIENSEIAEYFDINSEIWNEISAKGRSVTGLLFGSIGLQHSNVTKPNDLFEIVKRNVNTNCIGIIGAIAKPHSSKHKSAVICGKRLYRDAIVLVVLETNLRLGIGAINDLYLEHDIDPLDFALRDALLHGSIKKPRFVMALSKSHSDRMMNYTSYENLPILSYISADEILVSPCSPLVLQDESEDAILVIGDMLSEATLSAIENRELLGQLMLAQSSQESLLNLIPYAVLAVDIELQITHWNPSAVRLFGIEREDILSEPLDKLFPPRTLWQLKTLAEEIFDKKGTVDNMTFEGEILTTSDSLIQVEITIALNPHQEHYAMVAIINDITEHRKTEDKLRKERQAYRSIAEAAILATNIESLSEKALQSIVETLEFDIGTVRLLNPENNQLELVASYGVEQEKLTYSYPMVDFKEGHHLGAHAAFSKQGFFIPNTEASTIKNEYVESIREWSLNSSVIWPLISSGNSVIGVLNVSSFAPKELSDDDRTFFRALADMFSAVLGRRIEQEARELSEVQLRTMIQSMHDLVFVFDKEDRYASIFASDRSILYGDLQTLVGSKLINALPVDIAKVIIEGIHKVRRTGKPTSVDYPLVIDGKKLWFSANLSLHEDGISVVSVSRDVTRRVNAEEELKHSYRDLELYTSLLRHDFGNDLQLILNQIESGQILGMDEKKVAEILDVTQASATRMARVLQIFQERSVETSTTKTILPLVEEAVSRANEIHPHLKITMINKQEIEGIRVSGGRLLPMVFDNLLRNAAEYAGENPVVDIRFKLSKDEVQIDFIDDGPGVEPKLVKKLFEKGTSIRGSGLGLYLSQRVIEGYGGTIKYKPRSDGISGSVFHLTIPIPS